MARTHQQVSRASATVNDQTNNRQHFALDEVEEQARQLSNVEQDVDTIWDAIERMEAMMMHITQSQKTQPLQSIQQQQRQQAWREERRSSYVNSGDPQCRERSLHGLVSVSTGRNEAKSQQWIASSQQTGEKLMALRFQHTGVNSKAGTARSHLPESNRNRRHSEVISMGNNQGRSTTGNVFNGLGREADMRETLKRRWAQERFQHSTT